MKENYSDWNTSEYFETATAESVRQYLKAGADVHARDGKGRAPLHYAVEWNENIEVMKVLLKAGAKVNVRDKDGFTPLHFAAWTNANPEVVTVLLDAGADPKAKSDVGKTVWDFMKDNDDLKNTKAYWQVRDLQY